MTRISSCYPGMVAIAFVAACGLTVNEPSCTASASAVSASLQELVAADNARDLERVLSSYTDDVVWLPPAGPVLEGKPAIRPRYEQLFSRYSVNLSSEIVGAGAERSLGFVRGNTRGTLTPVDGGAAVTVDDKFLALLDCDQGAWRISHLMWSPHVR